MTDSFVDREFQELVAQDVRGALPKSRSDELRSDENLDNYHDALVALKKSMESQLANHKSRCIQKRFELMERGDDGSGYYEYLCTEVTRADGSTIRAPSDWRARTIRFLTGVEDHIAAVKARKRARNSPPRGDIIDELVDSIFVETS